jgi:hypothetical protein
MLPESLSRLTISTYISVRSDSRYALFSYTLSLSLNLNGTESGLDPRSKRFNQRDRRPLIDLQQSPPTPCSNNYPPQRSMATHDPTIAAVHPVYCPLYHRAPVLCLTVNSALVLVLVSPPSKNTACKLMYAELTAHIHPISACCQPTERCCVLYMPY